MKKKFCICLLETALNCKCNIYHFDTLDGTKVDDSNKNEKDGPRFKGEDKSSLTFECNF